MKSGNYSFHEYLEHKNRIFVIPIYQRYYNWGEKQCERLFSDLLNTIDGKRHFMGAIVYKAEGDSSFQKHIIIDGQQRVTSVTLLYLALYNSIKEIDENYAEDEILYGYIKNKYVDDEKFKIKLHSIEKDKKAFDQLLHNPDNKQKGSNIYDNYQTFKRLISEENQGYEPKEIFKAMKNFDIVYIELERDENPQKIFESLNSKGLKLSQGDLIRNYLLMGLGYDKQRELYKTYWEKFEQNTGVDNIDDFVRCYLAIKTGVFPKKENVYESFKTYLEKHKIDIEDILKLLHDYSIYYGWCRNRNSPHENINYLIHVFKRLKQEIVYALLISIFYIFDSTKNISEEDTIKIINFIVSYVYRRMVCGKSSSALNAVIGSLAHFFDSNKEKDRYESIVQNVLSRDGSSAMPNNEEFKHAFIEQDTKEPKSRYALETIERFLHKETIDFAGTQIEHIMPQKLNTDWELKLGKSFKETHSKYLNNIGNLTLTRYNSELSNSFFDKKKERYRESNIFITRKLDEYKEWGESSIKQRAKDLFETANKIWFYPDGFEKNIISKDKEYNIMDDIDPTGYTPQIIRINDKKIFVSSWKNMIEMFAEYLYDMDKEYFRQNVLKEENQKFILDHEPKKDPYSKNSDFREIKNSGIFINCHGGAITILTYCKRLCEAFDLEDDVNYTLNKNR